MMGRGPSVPSFRVRVRGAGAQLIEAALAEAAVVVVRRGARGGAGAAALGEVRVRVDHQVAAAARPLLQKRLGEAALEDAHLRR